jgi:ATPase subunit of ABC transporter with duplicated ATPase domains
LEEQESQPNTALSGESRRGAMQALRSRSGFLRKRGGGREFQRAARGSKEVVLEANNVSKTHDGSRYQLLSFSAAVSRGQRVALLGPNGGGKSSLLSVLSGEDTLLDSGSVAWPHGVSTAYLHQESLAHFHGTVLDAIFSANADLASALTEYRSALASGSTNFLTKSLERMDSLGAWSFEEDAKAMLATLGCDGMEDARVEQLSVGQRQRVAIVATLMKRADVLLLDEPTNSLSCVISCTQS